MNIKYILPANLPEVKSESRKPLPVYCLHCKTEIKHEFLVSLETKKDTTYETLYSEFDLLRCINCDSLTYRTMHYTDDDIVQIPDGRGGYELDVQGFTNYFPPRNKMKDKELDLTNKIIDLLPEPIQATFNEVVVALNNNLEILSGLGLRTLLEQICKHFIQEDDLGRILKKFEEEGYISTKQRYLLDDIRYIGNDSAHRAQSNSIQKHKLSLSILINLIQLLFAYYKYGVPKRNNKTSLTLKPSPKGETPKVRETTNKRKPKKIL